jgi:glycosyltransferase involved in cell wall biosynthesis
MYLRNQLKVLLIGNYANDRSESMSRFAELLRDVFQKRNIDAEILRPTPIMGQLRSSPGGLGKWLGYVDKFVLFPAILRRKLRELHRSHGNNLIVHICDHSNAMYVSHLAKLPHVTTCHDLLAIRSALGEFSESRTGTAGRLLQQWILSGLRRSAFVACVSEATRRDLVRLTAKPQARTAVVRLSLAYPYKPLAPEASRRLTSEVFAKRGLVPPSRYFFHIGNNSWYKNRAGLIRTFSQFAASISSPPALVLAGKPLTDDLEALIETTGLRDHIKWVGSLSNEELNAFYCSAEALIFPSLAEGFGWPVIEGQAAGCPVIASEIPSIVEIGGGAVIFINPKDTEAAAGVLDRFIRGTPAERDRIVSRGLTNAAHYSQDALVSGYQEIYEAVVAHHRRAPPVTPQPGSGFVAF